jgi:hypothetical protein
MHDMRYGITFSDLQLVGEDAAQHVVHLDLHQLCQLCDRDTVYLICIQPLVMHQPQLKL